MTLSMNRVIADRQLAAAVMRQAGSRHEPCRRHGGTTKFQERINWKAESGRDFPGV
ncbi:hypothetical protein [Burkholderia cenocepacia]|uniref:hypothetical protein n=1 Tax=Burkholderia cenocepacia TaxID=95486 RepID=UPI0013DFBFC5|nr:hypothetical protein [Burkholderia cenocepacia]